MTRLGARAALGALFPLAIFSACGVDSRGLTYEFHALDAAGATAAGFTAAGSGNTSAASSSRENAGDNSTPAAGDGGAANHPGDGSSNDAGSSTVESSGGSSADPPSGGAPSGGAPSNGGAAVAETGGEVTTDGSPPLDECTDLNHGCGPTLVQNAHFDTTVTGWVAGPSMTATWDATDSASNPSSGSLLLHYTALPVANAAGFSMAGASQCIPTARDTNYDVALRVMIPAGEVSGKGGMNVWMYDDAACQGNLVTASTVLLGGTPGKWTLLQGALSVTGADVHSLSIGLVASKAFTQADLKIFIDDVLFAKH